MPKTSEFDLYSDATPAPSTDLVNIDRPGGSSYRSSINYFAQVLEDAAFDARYALITDAYTKSASDAKYVPKGDSTGSSYTDANGYIGKDGTNTITSAADLFGVVGISPKLTQNANKPAQYMSGLLSELEVAGTGNIAGLNGNYMYAKYTGSGTLSDGIYGGQFGAWGSSAVAFPNLVGLYVANLLDDSVVDLSIGLWLGGMGIGGAGSLSKNMLLFVEGGYPAADDGNWWIWSGNRAADFADPVALLDGSFAGRNTFAEKDLGHQDGAPLFAYLEAYTNDGMTAALSMVSEGYHPSGTRAGLSGAYFLVEQSGAGTTTELIAFEAQVNRNAGTVTRGYGVKIDSPSGAMGTAYGMFVDDVTNASANYAIYTKSGAVRLGGTVGFNGNAPVGKQVSGGTTAGVIAGLVAMGLFSS